MSRSRTSVPGVVPTPSAGPHDLLTLRTPPAPAGDGPLDAGAAARLTVHIRDAWTDIGAQLLRLRELVEQARAGEAWRILGFSSWTAYLTDVLPPLSLPREQRREVVGWLSGAGMSSRAIAPIVRVDQKTVVNDRRRAISGGEETSSPPEISGLDGKVYPHRSPLVALPAAPAHASRPLAGDLDERLTVPASAAAQRALLAWLRHAILTHGLASADDWARGVVAAERPLQDIAN